MIDIPAEVKAIQRTVSQQNRTSGAVISVLARRDYPQAVADVWQALTDPAQIERWFLPVSGDLRVGGRFQTQGNAGGEILRCEAPSLLEITWGDATSIVQLRLSSASSLTTLELEHSVPLAFAQNGAGALFVGPGWDSALMALARFMRDEAPADPVAADSSLKTQRFNKDSLSAWANAVIVSGTATTEEVHAVVQTVTPQWSPDV
jgi:uncharacterized protein YndB with AHSA1/START domain